MNFKIERSEQYTTVNILNDVFGAELATEFASLLKNLFREGYNNIILGFQQVTDIDAQGLAAIKIANRMCINDLGILVVVSQNDALIDRLDAARIPDLTILPTIEESIDAVFINELQNEFGEGEEEGDEYGFGEDSEYGESGSSGGNRDDD